MNTKLGRRIFLVLCLLLPSLHAAEGSLNFDGVNDYVEVPNFQSLGVTNEVTVEFWAKTETQKQQSAFMLNQDDVANRFQAHLNYTDGKTYWDFGNINNGGRLSKTSPALSLNNWTHYALVASQSGNSMRIYVNGTLYATGSNFNAFEAGTSAFLRIGGSTNYFHDGSLDDFRVWNIARSEADIRRDLVGPLTGSEPGLRLYFKFDEGSGTTAVNSATATGTSYDGVLTNGPEWSAPAWTTYTVTNTGNAGTGSLRQVLADTAAAGGRPLVTFDPALSGQTITLGSEIVLGSNVAIDARSLAAGITINGGGTTRIFRVGYGQTASLSYVTLTGGNGAGGVKSTNGGAVFGDDNSKLILSRCKLTENTIYGSGGGIFTHGSLTVDDCSFTGNTAPGSGGAICIFSNEASTITRSTLSGNSAFSGGAIYNDSTTTLTQCTLSGNYATNNGGAIYNSSGTTTLTQCTVSGNTAPTGKGSGVASYGHNSTHTVVRHSIIAGNINSDVNFVTFDTNSFTSQGDNRIGSGNATGAFNQTGDSFNQTAATVKLAPLGSYGGPTQTMPPLAGSSAIDAAVGSAFTTDQRGYPIAGLADIGAVENGSRVTTGTDELDVVSSSGTGISLREAVRDCPSGGVIDFAPALSGGTCTLTTGLGGQIVLTKSVTIDARSLAAGITIDGGAGTNRIFTVNTFQSVSLIGLTLTGGNGDGATFPGYGGAIQNQGALTLTRCTLTGNSSNSIGGAIHNFQGTVALSHCTLTGNSSSGYGGAISDFFNTFVSSTLSLTHCTVSGNTATTGGGGIFNYGATTITNSIVAGNSSLISIGRDIWQSDFSGSFTYAGANVVQSYLGTAPGGPAAINAAPLLAPLGNYGGPTRTQPPLAGSPAIDAAVGSTFTTDQRGYPIAGVPDIGATEGAVCVTTGTDELDAISTSGTGISLREAVRDCPAGGVVGFVTALSGGTCTLTQGVEIVLSKSMIIDASSIAAGIIIDGGAGTNRIFNVNSGQSVSLIGLTLTGGNGAGAINSGFGGAILNGGPLLLARCTLSGNSASNGGGLYNFGTATVDACTFVGNTVTAAGGGISSQSVATVTRSTFSGNTANGSSTGGGAVNATVNSTSLTLENCTIVGNSATASGGAIRRAGGTVTIKNCIVAGNTAGTVGTENLGSPVTEEGVNLMSGDPLVAPLGNYGGPTKTMALKPGSPARNAAVGSTATSDQRGFPIVGIPDIGAYEAGTLNSFATWAWETTGGTLAFNGDINGDGTVNGLDYALRRDPQVGTTPLTPEISPGGSGGRLIRFRYQKDARDLRYLVQRSTDLGDAAGWTEIYRYDTSTGVITETGVTGAIDATTQLITLTDPAAGTRQFWRLVVEQVP